MDLRRFFAQQLATKPPARDKPDLYGVFFDGLLALLHTGPCTESEIMRHFGIERVQARKWMERAVAERRIERDGRPARYGLPPR